MKANCTSRRIIVVRSDRMMHGGGCVRRPTTIDDMNDVTTGRRIRDWQAHQYQPLVPLASAGDKSSLTLRQHHEAADTRDRCQSATDFNSELVKPELTHMFAIPKMAPA